MKVIVVDDSMVMRKIIVNVVESLGYEAIHATNGQHLIELLGEWGDEVGLILLDWNMPVLNGVESLRVLQENNRFQSIPVFMISTESEEARIDEAIKAGAKGYLAKPFTPEALAAKIKEVLGKKS